MYAQNIGTALRPHSRIAPHVAFAALMSKGISLVTRVDTWTRPRGDNDILEIPGVCRYARFKRPFLIFPPPSVMENRGPEGPWVVR